MCQLLNESDKSSMTLSAQSPGDAASAVVLMDRYGAHTNLLSSKNTGPSNDWYQWIDIESRRRLLSGCFVFDIHQSIYHQQPRSRAPRDESSSLLCLPCSDELWNASNPSEWQAQSPDLAISPLRLFEQHIAPGSSICSWSFTQFLNISWFASRLPPREDPSYPNEHFPQSIHPDVENFVDLFSNSPLTHSYLVFYYTPLHSLLAIAGDTWVFAQKITPPSAFQTAQNRLKQWSSSAAAAQAVHHACQILSQTLAQPLVPPPDGSPNKRCICDYWSLYVCALVCWAFGHRYQNFAPGSSTGTLTRSSSSTEIRVIDPDETPLSNDTRLKVLTYTHGMLDLNVEDLLTSKASVKGETVGVIDAVRQRLEIESVGNKCGMLVDAIVVLTKIKKAGKMKWF